MQIQYSAISLIRTRFTAQTNAYMNINNSHTELSTQRDQGCMYDCSIIALYLLRYCLEWQSEQLVEASARLKAETQTVAAWLA